MSGQQPPRHGIGGPSGLPVPAVLPKVGRPGPQPKLTRISPGQVAGAASGSRLIEVTQDQFFVNVLPDPKFQQIALHSQRFYNPVYIQVGSTISLTSKRVPPAMTYVICDVFFFATAPSTGLNSPSRRFNVQALSGLIRFELTFNNKMPMELEGSLISPYAAAAAAGGLGIRGGWPFVDRVFGVQRASAFGVYAKEQETIEVNAQVDTIPQFPITTLGVELHGFSLSNATFGRTWGK